MDALLTNKKQRLDTLLLARGLVKSRETARGLILSGSVFVEGEKIEALFHISQIKENALLLKPKENGSHITQMMLTLAPLPNGPFITEIRLFEENGNQSVFQFSNFRINTALSEQFFSFKIPEGVEVIDFTQNPQ